LIENYDKLTIKELRDGLKSLSFREKMRSPDSINSKIKRLKSEGKLDGYKKKEVVERALKQRGK